MFRDSIQLKPQFIGEGLVGWGGGGGGNCSLLNIFKKREPIKFQINALCIPSALNGKKKHFSRRVVFSFIWDRHRPCKEYLLKFLAKYPAV